MGKSRSNNGIGNLHTMGEDTTGTGFMSDGERADTIANSTQDKYHNFEGPKGKTDLDINSLADKIIKIVNQRKFESPDEMYDLDRAFGLETYWEPYERQVLNKINRTIDKNWDITPEDVVDHMIESYIYQYNKEYKNQRETNKFLRGEFRDDLIEVINQRK